MHISKEFLMEAVGLSLVVALLLIGMQVFNRAMKITSSLEERQEEKIAEIEEYEIVQYDGLVLDGMSAIGYIKKMIGNYGLRVHVVTETEEFVISDRSEYQEMRDSSSKKYINPLAKYRCMVIRDENDVITSVEIVVERAGW